MYQGCLVSLTFLLYSCSNVFATPTLDTSSSVVEIPLRRRFEPASDRPWERLLRKRDRSNQVTLSHRLYRYFCDVSIGTPPQNFIVEFDTGSSDLVVPSVGIASCSNDSGPCAGYGTYDNTSSTSYRSGGDGVYLIDYGGSGDFVKAATASETVHFAGHSLPDTQFYVASQLPKIIRGIMGFSWAEDKTSHPSGNITSPTILDLLKSTGAIKARVFSLFFDKTRTTGNLILGGVDVAQIQGPLRVLPMQTDLSSEVKRLSNTTLFSVSWTGLSLSTSSTASPIELMNDNNGSAVLDTGSSSLAVPQVVMKALLTQINGTLGPLGFPKVSCDLLNSTSRLAVTLGTGTSSVHVSIPVSDLVMQPEDSAALLSVPVNSTLIRGQCWLGVVVKEDSAGVNIMGIPFFWNSYVAFDLERKEIGFGVKSTSTRPSSIKEINNSTRLSDLKGTQP